MSTTSCPAPRRPADDGAGAVGESHRKTQVGPGAGDEAAQGAVALAAARSGSPSSGRRSSAAACRSLCRARRQRARVAAAQRASSSVGGLGGLGRRVGVAARRSGGRPRASTARRRTGPRPTTRCRGRRRGCDDLAAAGAERGAADAARTARRCRARRRARAARRRACCSVPQPVERDQRGGGVGRAAGHAAGDRDRLVDLRCSPAGRRRGARRAARRRGRRCCRRPSGHVAGVDVVGARPAPSHGVRRRRR